MTLPIVSVTENIPNTLMIHDTFHVKNTMNEAGKYHTSVTER